MANEFIVQNGLIVGRASGANITVVPDVDGSGSVIFDDRSGGVIGDVNYNHTTDILSLDVNGISQIAISATGVTVSGDLSVTGTTTTTDVLNLVVTDNIITINDGEVGAGVANGVGYAGIDVDRGTLDNSGWYYSEPNNWWGPAGPEGTYGAGIGATQTLGNIAAIDATDSTDQILTIVSNAAVILPLGSTAQRPTGAEGMLRQNSDTNTPEIYDGTNWSQMIATTSGTAIAITGDIDMINTHSLLNPIDPTTDSEVGDRGYTDGRYLQIDNNLSDLTNVTRARLNLGLTASVLDAVGRDGDTMYGSLTVGDTSDVEVVATTIAVAGTGYVSEELVTIVGGTFSNALVVKVLTVGGSGEILTYSRFLKGIYTVGPGSPAATTSSGSGVNATFNLTVTASDVSILPDEDYATAVEPRDIGKTNGEDGYAGANLRFRTVNAETFRGVATSALYADLAERYEADDLYDEGTVVVFGGDKEITVTGLRFDTRVAGVISIKPAYRMNEGAGTDETHPFVALKGKVPCKIIGVVKKGDLLTTSHKQGYAISNSNALPYTAFARALEDSDGSNDIIYVSII